MSVSNYTIENKYLIKDLDNWIYLYQFNEPILNYITDDGTLNASASDIMGSGYKVYCENVSYTSNSNINSRFSFENTLTLTIVGIDIELLNAFVLNDWMVLFKNKNNNVFILNAEYPIDVTYQYNINDENTPNSLTITLKSLSNTPIINFSGNLNYTILRDRPCGYNHSMIKRLRMLETTKGFISTSDNKIDVYMYRDTLKIIDFNPSSLSFTDSFNGDTYEQTLSFEIPLINNQFYFHYNILEYINNRYYCIVETTDGKYIVGGYKSGMFPSYAIEGNNIKITLTTNTTSNNILIADYISFNEIEYNHCVGIDGGCIDGLWTYKLIQRLELDGSVSNEYYALNGYENDYTDINIIGTYNRFDTIFGIKLTNPLYDCFKQCYISGLPSSLIFKNTGETQCFTIESDCDFTYSYDITIIDVTFNEDTNEFCVKSLKMDSSTQIKIITSDGINRFINVVIGTVGGEEGEYDRIYRWYYNGETYCLDENQQINCESAKTTTDTITSGVCTYYKTELYISPLCDGNYDFYGYGLGDLISCERIYRWVVSDNETEYYCDYKTYTKYALEYEEYSDDNGLTWIRTDNTRITDIVLEEYSEDCGFFFKGTGFEFTWLAPNATNYLIHFRLSDALLDKYASAHTTTQFDSQYNLNECSISLSTLDVDYKKCFDVTLSDYYNDLNSGYYTRFLYTVSKVPDTILLTDMMGMFYDNQKLISIDALSEFDTRNVITMKEMFYNCSSLTYLDFSSFDTTNVTNMDKMFYGCSGLTCLDLSNFNTSNLTTMEEMFYHCPNLNELNLSGWDLSSLNTNGVSINAGNPYLFFGHIPDRIYMCGCSESTIGTFRNLLSRSNQTANIITDDCEMICRPTNDDTMYRWVISEDENDYYCDYNTYTKYAMEYEEYSDDNGLTWVRTGYKRKTNIILSTNDCDCGYREYVYKISDPIEEDCDGVIWYEWAYCPTDESIIEKTGNYKTIGTIKMKCNILDDSSSRIPVIVNGEALKKNHVESDIYEVSFETPIIGFSFYNSDDLKEIIKIPSTSKVTTMNETFKGCTNRFESFDTTLLECFDTSNVTEMKNMFLGCWALTTLNLSSFNTSKVTTMKGMFNGCNNLTSLNISSFDTSNVTDMSSMFYGCGSLTSLNVSNFDTSNVTNMHQMFYNCADLTSLDLSSFNTSNVINMGYMFYWCGLTSLDLSNFDTSNVTNMSSMFEGCKNLTTLDLSNWDMTNVTYMTWMFDTCKNLTTIKVTNCDDTTIYKLQKALTDAGYTSTVSNDIITVIH